ncbi:fibronectin type III domain-containing protein [Helicobacter sp. 11S02629-2]|uniref:fibronectin type III domain-containing protein n=1 Tax=Helicobacter sp. 11S02629-2 TaxID=1476195 RepID=UPI000BA737F0|nr:fibronectin type III domain-containing protein [Helicobacter sp. 11S02629-2]PAF45649.1 hypothetical protein BKH40_01850 [Helicobacter sp. 11S02629-2]
MYIAKIVGTLKYALIPFIALFFIACANIFNTFGIKDRIDPSLPTINQLRILPDVSEVAFEWDLPSDVRMINGYVIFRENPKGEFQKVAIVKNPFATHYYDKHLIPQTRYVYAISTIGRDGSISPRSTPVATTTSFIDPVTLFYASKDYARSVKLIWSPSANPSVTGYIIEREVLKDGKKAFIKVGTTKDRFLSEYFDKDLEDGTSYNYRVISQSFAKSLSLPSNILEGRTRFLPDPIVNIKASDDRPKQIYIEWDKSKDRDVVSYNVYYSSTLEGAYSLLANVKGNSYLDNLQSDGTRRFYKVSAVDIYKLESKLSFGAAEGRSLPKPTTPTIVTKSFVNNIASFSWSKPSEARIKSYIVYRKAGFFKDPDKFDIDGNSFSDKEMKPGIKYTYSVSSVDDNGLVSEPSSTLTFEVGQKILVAPVSPMIPPKTLGDTSPESKHKTTHKKKHSEKE